MTPRYIPEFDDFCALAAQGNLVPVYREILADLETPVSAFLKIDDGGDAFLLESVEGGEKWARYSFLGSRAVARAVVHGRRRLGGAAGRTVRDAARSTTRWRAVRAMLAALPAGARCAACRASPADLSAIWLRHRAHLRAPAERDARRPRAIPTAI